MHVTMIAVTSVNGKTTRGDESDIYAWSSKEDQDLFFSLRDKASLIVMGRKTYEVVREKMIHAAGKRRIVMTKHPQAYKTSQIPHVLEFTDESPEKLIERLEKEGCTEILLVGGSEVHDAFLRARLVDEIHLTIEPRVFGKGKNLLANVLIDVQLRLREMKQLNDQGTLHLIYSVS